jgi:hypothetical protein
MRQGRETILPVYGLPVPLVSLAQQERLNRCLPTTFRLPSAASHRILGPPLARYGEGAMDEFLVIGAVLSVILLALWRWDEHARRAERLRRHLENRRRQENTTASYAG